MARAVFSKLSLLVLLISFNFSTPMSSGQDKTQNCLQKKVALVEVSDDNFHIVLGELASKYEIPIGVEMPVTGDTKHKANISPIIISNGDVRQVLDTITAIAPQYQWKDINGVINVAPIADKEPILDIKIQSLKIKEQTTDEIIRTMTELPEVKEKLTQMGLNIDRTIAFPSGQSKETGRFSFHLNNVTIRDVLNHLIKTTQNKYWAIHRVIPMKKYFAIMIW